MAGQRVFLTGATGNMGSQGLKELLKEDRELVILVLPTEQDRQMVRNFGKNDHLHVVWGDLTCYEDVKACVKDADIVLHAGALVSPTADYYPEKAMQVNYGSTINIIRAIKEWGQQKYTKLVYIGTVAETGDRMPPIHWGRVGDPLKPSVYDYYAVSKIAAERAVVESGLRYWVSLRQTGIMSRNMVKIRDGIMFHNGIENVLEYVSDRDSGIILKNVCGNLPETFWNHIYNIGGGETCRVNTLEMYEKLYGMMGIRHLENCLEPQWFATRNFHGQYYLDSDKLENYLHFRHDSIQYVYDLFLKEFKGAATATKVLCKTQVGEKLIEKVMKREFLKLARGEHGTVHFTEANDEEKIAAYWGSREALNQIPSFKNWNHFTDWNQVVPMDHGYDETKDEKKLSGEDMKAAAEFRGGELLSTDMEQGDWTTPLKFRCAFGHVFTASPRLVLEGGHWCDVCERTSWNYYERAKKDPFFAQVWTPLHTSSEKTWIIPKTVR